MAAISVVVSRIFPKFPINNNPVPNPGRE